MCQWQHLRFQDVYGLMINVYSIYFKPIRHLNVACFLLICDETNDAVQTKTS